MVLVLRIISIGYKNHNKSCICPRVHWKKMHLIYIHYAYYFTRMELVWNNVLVVKRFRQVFVMIVERSVRVLVDKRNRKVKTSVVI